MLAAVETGAFVYPAVKMLRQRTEQSAGSGVVGGDSRFDIAHLLLAGVATEDVVEHGTGKSSPAHANIDGHLPYKECVGTFGNDVTRDDAHDVVLETGNGTGAGEMAAYQQITVKGVVVQEGAVANQVVDRDSIGGFGGADVGHVLGAFLRIGDLLKSAHNRCLAMNIAA